MESKQLVRKLNTIFWWTLAVLPLIIVLFYFLVTIANVNGQGTTPMSGSDLSSYFNTTNLTDLSNSNLLWRFNLFMPSFVKTSVQNVLTAIGINEPEFLTLTLGWFITVEMYHLVIDVLLWVIRYVHTLLERSCD